MPINLDKLDVTIMGSLNDAAITVFNEMERWAACAGIKGDPENAAKAKLNHYGHPGMKGSWVPAREYITNAATMEGTHKALLDPTIRLRQVLYARIKDSVKRKQTYGGVYTYTKTSTGTNKAFGTTDSPRQIMEPLAREMLANQMAALASVTPKNTKATLKRKKKRSTQPLVDYGEMRAATRAFVTYDDKEP